jgi:hypothetical protein
LKYDDRGENEMKGILFVVLLMAALIVGILAVSDLTTKDEAGLSNIERVDRAREVADTAEKTLQNFRDMNKRATEPSQP